MTTGRRAHLVRRGRGALTLAALLLTLAAVLLPAHPRLSLADETAGRGDRTIAGRIADVLGDTVFEAVSADPAPPHPPAVGGPPQSVRTVSETRPAAVAPGGTQ
ncbi:hypothetical protein [Streptomyces sp. G-G2]|uniref:hypothetical protein n=1 Tax=Streptomyces sp. G-G2 TaxID=3046201 RepID=UPI0024BB3AAA|nr:hypothetical protein [Streptomyces sp. G-G2]MDJ0383535.1 hypothetical protein [Streptomyces sp. G-G2]